MSTDETAQTGESNTTEQPQTDLVAQLQAKGLNGNSPHAKIRAAYKEITGENLEMKDLPDLRARLGGVTEKKVEKKVAKEDKKAVEAEKKEAREKPAPKVKEIPTAAQALAKQKGLNPQRWNKVDRVTEQGPEGNITRVVIKCQNPQKMGEVDLCKGEREIAVQDLFQVNNCVPCQRRLNSIKRNTRTKGKRAENKAATDALNAQAKAEKEAASAETAA